MLATQRDDLDHRIDERLQHRRRVRRVRRPRRGQQDNQHQGRPEERDSIVSAHRQAPFLDVPGMVKAGKLRHYSPFLLCEAERNRKVVLHAGTLFDFYFMFPKEMSAGERKRLALAGMIDGLIDLVAHHEQLDSPELKVRTTSSILNERSARKLGLEKQPTDPWQKLILYYNYFNLTASYSLLNRRLSFPPVKSVQTFEGSMARMIERKPYLEKLKSSRRLAGTFE